ncbi:MAG: GtrA family protein [Oscillospiraceae bacterium]|nr:GtrA family protein [Oscillospiraceae bacterium]
MQALRYIVSSGIAFIIDYALILLFERLFGGFVLALEAAAIAAWMISSQVNFWINRIWVFRSQKSFMPELGGYYALAAASFSVKTFVLLELMVRVLTIPLAIAKPVAEVVMFAANFIVQKTVIFKRNTKKENP